MLITKLPGFGRLTPQLSFASYSNNEEGQVNFLQFCQILTKICLIRLVLAPGVKWIFFSSVKHSLLAVAPQLLARITLIAREQAFISKAIKSNAHTFSVSLRNYDPLSLLLAIYVPQPPKHMIYYTIASCTEKGQRYNSKQINRSDPN